MPHPGTESIQTKGKMPRTPQGFLDISSSPAAVQLAQPANTPENHASLIGTHLFSKNFPEKKYRLLI